jgi:hypothetical protein
MQSNRVDALLPVIARLLPVLDTSWTDEDDLEETMPPHLCHAFFVASPFHFLFDCIDQDLIVFSTFYFEGRGVIGVYLKLQSL